MAKPDVGARRLPPTRPTRAHHPRGTLAVALSTKGELAGPANGTPWGGSIVGPYPHVQCEAGPHAALSQKGPLAFAQTSVFAHDWAWRPMVNPAISNLISLKFDNFYCQAGSSGHCSLYSYWMSSTALVRDGGGANRRHDYPMTDPSNGSDLCAVQCELPATRAALTALTALAAPYTQNPHHMVEPLAGHLRPTARTYKRVGIALPSNPSSRCSAALLASLCCSALVRERGGPRREFVCVVDLSADCRWDGAAGEASSADAAAGGCRGRIGCDVGGPSFGDGAGRVGRR